MSTKHLDTVTSFPQTNKRATDMNTIFLVTDPIGLEYVHNMEILLEPRDKT
ncbi:MAG: hypothetical protein ACFFB5_09885 [Promethearchaeota archaeon]